VFAGEFRNNFRFGYGIHHLKFGKEVYEGGFKENKRQGPGILVSEGKKTYGYFEKGLLKKKGSKREISDLVDALMGGRPRKDYESYMNQLLKND